MADEAGLDLVEIAPMADPPVCKVMDFGKFKYQEQKKAHEARLKQKQVQIKEVDQRGKFSLTPVLEDAEVDEVVDSVDAGAPADA